jgi:hypothetical protein
MNRNEIINTVKAKIDELTPINGLTVSLSGFDDKPIDMFINYILDECADDIQRLCPLWMLEAQSANATTHAMNEYSGYVDLPGDFLRLISFKMKMWFRSVTVPVMSGTVAAERQKTVLRGRTAKPVCVIGHGSDTSHPEKETLEYYSTTGNNHELEHFLYAKRRVAEDLRNILIEPLTWHCASNVLQICGNESFKAAEERAATAMIHH